MIFKKKNGKKSKRQWPSTERYNARPQTMYYADTDTLIKLLWGQVFNLLQILQIPLSTHPHIFVSTTNLSSKDSD